MKGSGPAPEDRYQLLFEQSPAGLFHYDPGLRLTECNRSLVTILRSSRERLIGLDLGSLRDQRVVPALRTALAGAEGRYEGPYQSTTSGADLWITLRAVPFHDAAGRVSGGIGIVEDVTEQRQAEAVQGAVYEISEAVHAARDLGGLYRSIHAVLARLMPADNCFVALYDAASDTVSFTYFVDRHDPPPAPRRAGRGLTELVLGSKGPLLASGADLRRLDEEGRIVLAGALPTSFLGVPLRTIQGPLGALVLQSYDPEVHFDERDRDVLVFVADQVAMAIQRKRHEAQIEQMAYLDGLTGLANRRMLQEHALRCLAAAERRGTQVAILYLDLDRFKDVNDSLGHDAGDELLAQIARHLQGHVRRSDVLARLGGDEFAVLLEEADPETAAAAARRLLSALDRPFEVRGRRVQIGGSVGIALFPDHGSTLETLLKNADVAMYRVKAGGGGAGFFDAPARTGVEAGDPHEPRSTIQEPPGPPGTDRP